MSTETGGIDTESTDTASTDADSTATAGAETPLRALALVCTLTPSPGESSTELMAQQMLDALESHGVTGSSIRLVDLDIRPGVQTDMGPGDEWPSVRERILDADIVIVATPTWAGQLSSVAQRVLERLDAELSETDESGKPTLYDKVALVGVVGNEDGAHHITGVLYQGLSDFGFTIAAQGVSYWNGEAMGSVDYKDLDSTPDSVASATSAATANAAHLARLLRSSGYPKP